MSADATVVRKRGRPKKVVAPSDPEVSLPEPLRSGTAGTKKRSPKAGAAAAVDTQEAGTKTNGRTGKVAAVTGKIEGAAKASEKADDAAEAVLDAGTNSTRSSKSGPSGLKAESKADKTSTRHLPTSPIEPHAKVKKIAEAITELQNATLELKRSAPASPEQASVSTTSQATESKQETTSTRLLSATPIEPHERVKEIADVVAELQEATLELQRSVPASPKQASVSTTPQSTESKTSPLPPTVIFNIPIIPTPPSLEEPPGSDTVFPPSSTAAHPTLTTDTNIPILPIPSPLEEPPQPTILLPHAFTSDGPAHEPTLPTSKILTALAAALAATRAATAQQSQIHDSAPIASMAVGLPSSTPSRSNQPHPSPRTIPKPNPQLFTGLPPPLQPNRPRKSPPGVPPAAATATTNQKTFKTAYRKWTMVMVALPIAFVTSWVLFERLALGKEQRRLGGLPDRSAATTVSGVAVEKSER